MENCRSCWCGNSNLVPFSEDYSLCEDCYTLVLRYESRQELADIERRKSFYGKSYWYEYQYGMGLPDIEQRARNDFSDLVLYWLRTLLKYRLPPGSTLEIGCAHGAFVRMLQDAGFEAEGLELDSWVAGFAKKAFSVRVMTGALEELKLEGDSRDVIIMMDVLEHLPDPLATMQECRRILKSDGLVMLQTPCFPAGGATINEWRENDNPFLSVLRDKGHLYLYSEQAVRLLLESSSFPVAVFEPAIFPQYDMFLVAGSEKIASGSQETVSSFLELSSERRYLLGLLDLYAANENLKRNLRDCEKDRTDRLKVIERIAKEIKQLSGRLEETEKILEREMSNKELLVKEVVLKSEEISRLRQDVSRLEKKFLNRLIGFVRRKLNRNF